MDQKTRFLIIGNGRTGSSWLLTSLDSLPDVNARKELKWNDGTFEVRPAAHHLIDRRSSVRSAIDEVADDHTAGAEILGSKLIFNPYKFYGPSVFAALANVIEADIRLILLKRSYLETWLSWNVRGVTHSLNEQARPPARGNTMIEEMRRIPKQKPKHLLLCNDAVPLDGFGGEALRYELSYAIDGLFQFYANDMQALALCRERGGFVIDYAQIDGRLLELARFIGSRATEDEIVEILRQPQTLKLPRLEQYLHPIRPLQDTAAELDQSFAAAASGTIANPFRWQSDTEIAVGSKTWRIRRQAVDALGTG